MIRREALDAYKSGKRAIELANGLDTDLAVILAFSFGLIHQHLTFHEQMLVQNALMRHGRQG